ncbi:MAG TPA: DEAD/DEAH box helicase, partial [Isosphaeraceae bacterium]
MARDDNAEDGLERFLPAVAAWFRAELGRPTPPQRQGWPAIAAGQHTLILAPTGSGKTLAAFLAALDGLWRTPRRGPGVRILYISPLKALGADVLRNLQIPLEGITTTARLRGEPLPPLEVAIRTGDTPAAERRRLARRPPDILITTPESLHLMLTSRAREALRGVSHVIVDEIHALCSSKRGVFLALLLERLEALVPGGFVRVGLSATQRPLEEVARFLGGLRRVRGDDGAERFEPRPVTIIDAGSGKPLDLEVGYPAAGGGAGPAGPSWPAIARRLRDLIAAHRSTIVFANNRRVVERLTADLNAGAGPSPEGKAPRAEGRGPGAGSEPLPDLDSRGPVGSNAVALPGLPLGPVASDLGPVASDLDPPPAVPGPAGVLARAHHGSLSPERRQEAEEALKRGELPAVVATASLELGIDMGAVDLVCQVESPGGVARGLQRVGRAGHVVGRPSKGRLLAKTAADLLEAAALARAMLRGEVEALRVPTNCLDVLAQQVVACVAMDRWDVPALFDLVRGAYPYRDLSASAFEAVLGLVAGRFRAEAIRDLRPRVSWDRVHNRLHPLPGTAHLALVGGGTIPETGQYPLYLGDGGPRLGELDEEFVLERRLGEAFVLGTATWRIEAIEPHRVLVSRAEGREAQVPFWRGEAATRTAELGREVGALCRELAARRDEPGVLAWLREEYRLDAAAARALRDYVARQVRVAGAVPDDRTVLVEAFRDPVGELGLAVLSPWGGTLHRALTLALRGQLRRRLGIDVACLHGDDGLLIRLPGTDAPPPDLFAGLTADRAETLIRAELSASALFGLRFRQNAGRALLLPRPDPSKRTPLWLQRLRARDLLQVVGGLPDFPIVLETYRECLDDDLDLPRLRAFLDAVQDGSIRVVVHRGEAPSPFAAALLLPFTQKYLYQWDEPRRGNAPREPAIDGEGLDRLLVPGAVGRVDDRLRGKGHPPRTADEMAEWLRRLGDLAPRDLAGPMLGFLVELEAQGRATTIELPGTAEPSRWIGVEEGPLYASAFGPAQVGRPRCPILSPSPLVEEGRGGGAGGQAGGRIELTVPATPHPNPPPQGGRGPEKTSPGQPLAREEQRFRFEPDDAIATIVRRFLQTHALIGLDELTARYPIDPGLATELLERWAEQGLLVRLEGAGDDGPRWAERGNLDEVRRLSLALRRRESVAVAPEVFADFVARWQHVHPESRREGSAAVGPTLEQFSGFAAPAELWEAELLPRRVRAYRPAWLDEALGAGGWLWRAEADGRGEPRVAIVPRDFPGGWPTSSPVPPPDEDEARVLDCLGRRGAAFVADVARETG